MKPIPIEIADSAIDKIKHLDRTRNLPDTVRFYVNGKVFNRPCVYEWSAEVVLSRQGMSWEIIDWHEIQITTKS